MTTYRLTTVLVALWLAGGCSASATDGNQSALDGDAQDGGSEAGTSSAKPRAGRGGSKAGAGGNKDDSSDAAGTGGSEAGAGGRGAAGSAGGAAGAGGRPADAGRGGSPAAASGGTPDAAGSGGGGGSSTPSGPANTGAAMPTVSDEIVSTAYVQKMDQAVLPERVFAVPVLLYKGGLASFNTELVTNPIDIAYDFVEHPQDWPAWRRNAAGTVELQRGGVWGTPEYSYEVKPLPKGTTLAGTFNWGRDTAIGTDAAVKFVFRYRFKADGTFERCKSTVTAIPAIPSITRKQEPFSGKYEIDGYKLKLTYDTGGEDTIPFFYDPTRPTRLWLGPNHYPVVEQDIPEICIAL